MNTEQVQQIFVEDIIPNRFQPRLTFDEKALKELSDSIKVHGVIQPLVLRKVGNKYEIIAGERRYKASCMAGLKQVPAIVREMTDNESAEIALIENVQRKNLTSIEEAKSYRNLLDRGYLTQEELANKLGVSQSTIANKLRLLNLCEEVQNALLNEQISERHARSLLAIDNPDEQKRLLDRIIKERLTVRQLDGIIKQIKEGEPFDGPGPNEVNSEVNDMNNQMNMMNNQNAILNGAVPPEDPGMGMPNTTPQQPMNQPMNQPMEPQMNAPMQPATNMYNPFTKGQMSGNVPMNSQVPPMNDPMNAPMNNQMPNQDMMQPQMPVQDPYMNQPMNDPMNSSMNMPMNGQMQAPGMNNTGMQGMPPYGPNLTDVANPNYISPQGDMTANMDYDPTTVNPMPGSPVNVDTTASVVQTPQVETFNMFGDIIDPNAIKEADEPEAAKQLNIGDQINYVREVIENIKTNGFEVDTEEFDLADIYQITIKIKKPNKEENN